MEVSNPDLEQFRRQWRAEVSARRKPASSNESSTPQIHHTSKPVRKQPGPSKPLSSTIIVEDEEEESGTEEPDVRRSHTDTLVPHREPDSSVHPAMGLKRVDEHEGKIISREPRSALEHYERAAEREAVGNLGDSLNHYRKAFKVVYLQSATSFLPDAVSLF